MKEKNDPTLFVNSISVYRAPEAKQNNHKFHRVDDIKALLSFNKKITVEVLCKNKSYKGLVSLVKIDGIVVQIDSVEHYIKYEDVEDIKILEVN